MPSGLLRRMSIRKKASYFTEGARVRGTNLKTQAQLHTNLERHYKRQAASFEIQAKLGSKDAAKRQQAMLKMAAQNREWAAAARLASRKLSGKKAA